MTRKAKLTDDEWRRVYEIQKRCRVHGGPLAPEEQRLVDRAIATDPKRYKEQSYDAFDATVPFGSEVKSKRGK